MKTRSKVGFWLFILLLLVAVGWTYLRFNVPECQDAQANQYSNEIVLKCVIGAWSDFRSLFDEWDSERTIAVFTVLLFVATFLLWKATRDLVRSAEKTAERQMRAYLGIEKIEVSPSAYMNPIVIKDRTIPGITADNTLKISVKNFGQTPAKSVIVFAHFAHCPIGHRLGENIFIGTEKWDHQIAEANTRTSISRYFLNPGQMHTTNVSIWDNTLWSHAYQNIITLYVHGRIYFVDAFNVNRRITFCYSWEPSRGLTFTPHECYNDEDKKPPPIFG